MSLAQSFAAATAADYNFDASGVVLLGEESFESHLVDANDYLADAERDEVSLEGFIGLAASLTDMDENLEASLESMDIEPTAAKFILAHANDLHGRVGLAISGVSTESMSSPSAVAAGVEQISMENSGLWQKLVDAIISMIQKIRVAMKKFWIKLTDGAPALGKRAQAIAERARNVKGAIEEKTFEFSGAGQIHLSEKAPTAAQVVAQLTALQGTITSMTGKTKKQFTDQTDGLKKVFSVITPADSGFQDTDNIPAKLKKAGDTLAGALNKPMDGLTASNRKYLAGGDGTQAYISSEYLGGKVISQNIVTDPAKAADLSEVVRETRIGLANLKEKTDVESTMDIETVPAASIIKGCDDIVKIADQVSRYKKEFEARDKMVDTISKELRKISDRLKKADAKLRAPVRRYIEDCIKAGRQVSQRADAPFAPFSSHVMSVSRVCLNLFERSLAQYKEKD